MDTSLDVVDANDDRTSLREAIVFANLNPGPDVITFDAGEFRGGASSLIRLTQGELQITESLTIDGSTGTDVVITGDADGNDVTLPGGYITNVAGSIAASSTSLDDNSRVLDFQSPDGNLTLSGITLTGGYTVGGGGGIRFNGNVTGFNINGSLTLISSRISGNGTTGENANGGGILARGRVTLTDSIVAGNSTSGESAPGGGIATSSRVLSLFNSVISGNSTSGDRSVGGGVLATGGLSLAGSSITGNSTSGYYANGGGIAGNGSVTLTDSVVSGNRTTGNRAVGGAIYTVTAPVRLTNSIVSDNSTSGSRAYGGGIRTDVGNVTLTNSTVSGNRTDGNNADGGGIRTYAGNVTLINSTLSNNKIAGFSAEGGGIRTHIGNVTLTSSTVSGNSTSGDYGSGGGIATIRGVVTLSNSTLSGNMAAGNGADGGGVRTHSGSVTITSSTISGNSASGSGGGVSVNNTTTNPAFTASNSIIAGNLDSGLAPDLQLDPQGVLKINHSLVGNTTGSGIGLNAGVGNLFNTPAMLGPLADNGGPTKTHALLPYSPSIDTGDPAGPALLTADQRGNGYNRTADGGGGMRVDMGAYEAQGTPTRVSGDFNGDGVVDAADYTVWRDTLGATEIAPLSGADGDGDGEVTVTDYQVWRSHFGFVFLPLRQEAVENLDRRPVQSLNAIPSDGLAIDLAFAALFAPSERSSFREVLAVRASESIPACDSRLLLTASVHGNAQDRNDLCTADPAEEVDEEQDDEILVVSGEFE